jgi:hypothetical protein
VPKIKAFLKEEFVFLNALAWSLNVVLNSLNIGCTVSENVLVAPKILKLTIAGKYRL